MAILVELLGIVMVLEIRQTSSVFELVRIHQGDGSCRKLCIFTPSKMNFRPRRGTIFGVRRPQKSNFWTRFGSIFGPETGSIFGTK